MTPENFCYWLRGYFEILNSDKNKVHIGESLSIQQTKVIQDHLELVFTKVTPEVKVDDKTVSIDFADTFTQIQNEIKKDDPRNKILENLQKAQKCEFSIKEYC